MDLSPDEDNFPGRLLHQAALWDNLELLQELIASGTPVDARDASARTAVHAAALAERSRCLAALCAAEADVNAQQDEKSGGKTALHIAAERGHVENIKVLIQAGAALHLLDCGGDTALALAERGSHRHAAHALREARDVLERERLTQHSRLRELVLRADGQLLRANLTALGPNAGLIVNLAPGGANTLLYVAAEGGQTASVRTLLGAGADGRAHPVTRYSPLYIACYHGHLDIAELLLEHFPDSVQQETVERWLPLHAACIGGHASVVTLLLEYKYPETLLQTYVDPTGEWQYQAAFDINATDVSGQTALYVASTLGNLPVVDALLNFVVCAVKIPRNQQNEANPVEAPTVLSPSRGGISLGIHAIVNKLTGNSDKQDKTPKIRPIKVSGDALGAAVQGAHTKVATRLLLAGADPDVVLSPSNPQMQTSERGSERSRGRSSTRSGRISHSPSPSPGRSYEQDGPWTPLALAARDRNTQLVELLLQYGATDVNNMAIRQCDKHALWSLMAAILATKAYPDPDYKINKSMVSDSVFSRDGDSMLTYSALFPNTPVMISWTHCLRPTIRMKWIRDAALKVNPRLGSDKAALHAITRIDISNNELRHIPAELLTLVSLRYLNIAQNKLERLPSATEPLEEEESSTGFLGKIRKKKLEGYTAPVLEELYLQDNRLEELPPSLFSLPSLSILDVSNNKLRQLPVEMWSAHRLRDLNAALNHLRDLPYKTESEPSSPATTPLDSPLMTSSPSTSQFVFTNPLMSESRSPSIERSMCETDEVDDNGILIVGNRSGNAVRGTARRIHAWRYVGNSPPPRRPSAPLIALNLSHNQFTQVPPTLACQAPGLTRLNMAYNSLRSMSYVTSYPSTLRQLDLSHNEITCWPSLPQVENYFGPESGPLACYCSGPPTKTRPKSGTGPGPSRGSVRAQLLSTACGARRHLRLEALRTLILANNLLTRIQLTTDDDGSASSVTNDGTTDEDDDWASGSSVKGRLLFPLLSMLDVSSNLLRCVPSTIQQLTNLSVLNISGNKDITDLPPQMGLLSRLWNLNTNGCPLHEPLRSMISCGRYKSMDIVGYLKSVLQEAQPYTRIKLMIVGLQGIGKTSLLECLRQESNIVHRRKPTEHWAKRMGNKTSRKVGNMSTVGVDIGTWLYEKHRSSKGPVTFRTWDFGGQQEYYATHQYFLSRRSLYLVVWKVTDGKKGLAGAVQWLRSIQARAPGSPVIMVATHYDQVANSNLPESESPEVLQRIIRTSIMGAQDADKLGLPKVHDSLEVSCCTRHNIRLLADILYSVAFSVKPPGSKECLLEQRVPVTYLNLEECVIQLANELKEPVVKHEEFKKLVTQYMQQKNLRMFRDSAELHQATMFLHENGVILHYDDATLKELYFLRPQWLCDVLAHVVTVREINPFASNGIMKVEDLSHVFKASPLLARSGEEASSLALSLLNKFELALCWDVRCLLVPPLLGAKEPNTPQLQLRSRNWSNNTRGTPRRAWLPSAFTMPSSSFSHTGTDSPKLINDSPAVTITARECGKSLRRLLLMSYVPLGFWPRLCTRVLADEVLADCAPALYRLPNEVEIDPLTAKALDLNWSWKLWQSGITLVCGDFVMLRVSGGEDKGGELWKGEEGEPLAPAARLRIRQDGVWSDLDPNSSSSVEIFLPAQVCVVRREDGLPIAGYQSISLEPSPEILAKLLALLSDHVDLLLEDWYPSLGTRFVHTSEGRCLITRVVMCPSCLRQPAIDHSHQMQQVFRRLELNEVRQPRGSEESRASDGDSGVGGESAASSRIGSVEGALSKPEDSHAITYGWTVEECILMACSAGELQCPSHGEVTIRDVAPDTGLLDVEESKRARWEQVRVGNIVGRGSYGTVARGTWNKAGVAVKLLQPHPPTERTPALVQAYKVALSRWDRSPSASATRAYCALRQELSVMVSLRHPHVLPLRAVCTAPLAILLDLAQCALSAMLRTYLTCGVRVGVRVVRALWLQVARAMEYLHAKRIVYRDLKAENVLVWSMPKPQESVAAERSSSPINVHVKLGDYGISRLAPPSGTKGFGGTEGFMAPEIMRYNGEEEYTEKVDCFSFGMLLYEILTLKQPFEGHEAIKEAVLDGARPTLTPRDVEYPCSMLATMRGCWHPSPRARPSAAALVALAAAPEARALADVSKCHAETLLAAVTTSDEGAVSWEVWGSENDKIYITTMTRTTFTHTYTFRLTPGVRSEPVMMTAACVVGHNMWVGDSSGRITVYSVSRLNPIWSVMVHESVGGAISPISALHPLPSLNKVALSTLCGRLFLVTSDRPEAEGSFVLTELGTAAELRCLVAVPNEQGFEIWAGGEGLFAYTVTNSGVCAANTLSGNHVTLLANCDTTVITYCEPGCVIEQWCVSSKTVVGRLDCSKLVPCSESLQSIAIEERLSPGNCQVTALCCAGDKVYCGTAWGCIIVAEADSLRPVTVFRPYEQEVVSLVPLPRYPEDGAPMLVSVGKGYRPLLNRYAPPQSNAADTSTGNYCLLWSGGYWLPD